MRRSLYPSLLSKDRRYPFFSGSVTADKKGNRYDNVKQSKPHCQPLTLFYQVGTLSSILPHDRYIAVTGRSEICKKGCKWYNKLRNKNLNLLQTFFQDQSINQDKSAVVRNDLGFLDFNIDSCFSNKTAIYSTANVLATALERMNSFVFFRPADKHNAAVHPSQPHTADVKSHQMQWWSA